ncbi:MAG: hypothetical protein NXI32_10645 [bacterium]|nr:hypothetical protein [bacterium]
MELQAGYASPATPGSLERVAEFSSTTEQRSYLSTHPALSLGWKSGTWKKVTDPKSQAID